MLVVKKYVDNLFSVPSLTKKNTQIDLNDRNITNARFIQFNQLPQIDSLSTAKLYVDNAIDESSLNSNKKDSDFNNNNLTNINNIKFYKQAENGTEVITKAHVDEFHQGND